MPRHTVRIGVVAVQLNGFPLLGVFGLLGDRRMFFAPFAFAVNGLVFTIGYVLFFIYD